MHAGQKLVAQRIERAVKRALRREPRKKQHLTKLDIRRAQWLAAHPLTLLQWKIVRFLAREKCPEDARWFEFTNYPGYGERLSFSYCHSNDEITAEATKAAKGLLGTPYVIERTNEFRTFYGLTETGRLISAEEHRPAFTPPAPPPLREIEHEVLRQIAGYTGAHPWFSPMEFGGRNSSQHSAAAYRLVLHGLLEMQKNAGEIKSGPAAYPTPQIFKRGKGACRFRVTAAGLTYYKKLCRHH